MKRIWTTAVASAAVLLGASSAWAASIDPADDPPALDTTPLTCDEHDARFHIHRARGVIAHAFRTTGDRWKLKHPFTRRHRAWVRRHRICLDRGSDRARISRYRERKAHRFERWVERQGSWCAPASMVDPAGAGCWVIPASIVECESGGSWTAANPSGAQGPYQLLGHGQPWPVDTQREAMAHHRIAAALWDGGAGRSAWVC